MDYPYIDDPLFEYVNIVANNFWWEPIPDFDEETNEEYFIENPSFVPSRFARRYLDGKIDLSTLSLYCLDSCVIDSKALSLCIQCCTGKCEIVIC